MILYLVLSNLKPSSIVINVVGTQHNPQFQSRLKKKVTCIQQRNIELIEVTESTMIETTTSPPATLSNTCYDSCPEAALYLPRPGLDGSLSENVCPTHCHPIEEKTSPCHSKTKIIELKPPPEFHDCFIVGVKKIETVTCVGTCDLCQNEIDIFTGLPVAGCTQCQPDQIEKKMRLRCPNNIQKTISFFISDNCSCK